MGSGGFEYASQVEFLPHEVILEVGSERGEGSTQYLARLAPLVSIDIEEHAYERARATPNVTAVNALAEDYLETWDGRHIRFAWLDGHDWPYNEFDPKDWHVLEEQYIARGQGYSQEASAQSHLTITKLIEAHMPIGAFAAYDDTWIRDDGTFDGKGKTAVPWLITHRWVVETSHRSLIIMKKAR